MELNAEQVIRELIQNAIALINSQKQRIKELTQMHEMLSESYDHLEKTKDELLSERARLTEENESLRAEKEHLELVVEGKLKHTSALEKQVLSLTEENKKIGIENFDLICKLSRIKEDTVRELRDKLLARKVSYGNISFRVVPIDDIETVCREMIGGGSDGKAD